MTTRPAAVLTASTQLNWAAALQAAQLIVRICNDAGFIAPEALDVLRANIAVICSQMDVIARSLLITPMPEVMS